MNVLSSLVQSDRINLERVNFLLIDANQQSLDILGHVVAGFGARTIHKCEGIDAGRNHVRNSQIDFLMIDWSTQLDEGLAFLTWLRREAAEPTRYIPAIVITGDTSTALVRKGRDAGAQFVIAKPVTPKVLLDRILWMARENRVFVECASYVGPDRRFRRVGPPPGVAGRRAGDLSPSLDQDGGPNLSQEEINALMKPARASL